MFDSAPDSIIARLVRRDGQVNTDDIAVYLDPYHDRRTGFYFGLNAAGTHYDGVLYNDEWDDNTWDGVWEGRVHVDNQGWTAEMRIPYSQLRFQDGDRQVWGVNFIREISRKNEKDYIVYTPRNESGFVSRFADLVGIDHIAPPSRVEILPYISTKAQYLRHTPGDPFNDGSQYVPGAGVDVKFGIGSNLTVDGTVNPDFGQVELDPAVVNLTDVETVYDEKRPFFVEGSSIFNFGYGGSNNNWGFNWGGPSLFYSRRIGRPPQAGLPDGIDYADRPSWTRILGAGKLSGKLGDNISVGAISAVTAREHARVESAGARSDVEVEPLTYYGVFRGQKEFAQGKQGLGFLSTIVQRGFHDERLRNEYNKGAVIAALDGWTFLDSAKVWVVTGWAATSYISGSRQRITDVQRSSAHYFQRPDASHLGVDTNATHLQGFSGRIALNKQRGSFYVNAAFGFIDPGFDPNDLGFMWRNDMINSHLVLGYRWREPNTVTRQVSINAATFRTYDFGGNLTWWGYWTSTYVQFLSYHSIDWSFAYNPEAMSNRRTRGGPLTIAPSGFETNLSMSTDDRSNWIFTLSGSLSRYRFNSDNGKSVGLTVEAKPADNIAISFTPSISWYSTGVQWVTSTDDPLATATYGHRYIFSAMDQREVSAGIRLDWTFTPSLTLQMFVQPYMSVGDYSALKELRRPRSFDFATYGTGGSTITRDNDAYIVDPDGNGPAQPITVSDPNFNQKSLRSSAVLRWEYARGSTMYVVWTQQRDDASDPGSFRFGRDFSRIFQTQPDNVFMIKLTYWGNP
jgi:hypothetical protein